MSMWINGIWETQQPLPTHQKRRGYSPVEEQCFALAYYFLPLGPASPAFSRNKKGTWNYRATEKWNHDSFGVGGDLRNHCVLFFNVMDGKAVNKGMGEVTDFRLLLQEEEHRRRRGGREGGRGTKLEALESLALHSHLTPRRRMDTFSQGKFFPCPQTRFLKRFAGIYFYFPR